MLLQIMCAKGNARRATYVFRCANCFFPNRACLGVLTGRERNQKDMPTPALRVGQMLGADIAFWTWGRAAINSYLEAGASKPSNVPATGALVAFDKLWATHNSKTRAAIEQP